MFDGADKSTFEKNPNIIHIQTGHHKHHEKSNNSASEIFQDRKFLLTHAE